MSADSPYTQNKIQHNYSSTATSLILILIQSLYTIKNPETLLASPLNVCDLATSMFNLVLGLGASAITLATSAKVWSYTYMLVICF